MNCLTLFSLQDISEKQRDPRLSRRANNLAILKALPCPNKPLSSQQLRLPHLTLPLAILFDDSRRKTPQTLPLSGLNRGLIRAEFFGISGPCWFMAGSTPAVSATGNEGSFKCSTSYPTRRLTGIALGGEIRATHTHHRSRPRLGATPLAGTGGHS